MKRPATAELRLAHKIYSKMVAISTFALGRNSTLSRRTALGPLRFGNERCDMRVDLLEGKVRPWIVQRRTEVCWHASQALDVLPGYMVSR